MKLQALLLDCDGVLAETERDGHRVAFNRAFAEHGLDIEWSAELYRELLQVAGGKERMRAWFERAGWPAAATDRDAFIRLLHATKTRHFLSIVAAGGLRARPGVRRIIDEALASGVRIAICSTSDERSVRAVTRSVLGVDRAARLAGIGDSQEARPGHLPARCARARPCAGRLSGHRGQRDRPAGGSRSRNALRDHHERIYRGR